MSTLEERLRAEMARSVAAVRPAPEPYARLMRRRNRRRWRWGGTGIATAIVAALIGAQSLVAPAGPTPPPAPISKRQLDQPLTSWTRKLLAAPTHGDVDLAERVRQALDQQRAEFTVAPELHQIKVLFAVEVGGAEVFAAAYYSDQRALAVSGSAPVGTDVGELLRAPRAVAYGALMPLVFGADPMHHSVVLVPAGCVAEESVGVKVDTDSSLRVTWGGAAEFVVDPGPAMGRWWRVTCAGKVQQQEYLGPTNDEYRQKTTPWPLPVERGNVDPAVVKELLWSWPTIGGLAVRSRRVVWGGTPPGETRPTAVGIGELADGSVMVCQVTGQGDSSMIMRPPTDGEPTLPADFPTKAWMSEAVAPSAALVTVRLPHETKLGYSDRLLVIAPPEAVQLRVAGQDSLILAGGVGVVTAAWPADIELTAVGADGREVAEQRFREPSGDDVLAGQGMLYRWK